MRRRGLFGSIVPIVPVVCACKSYALGNNYSLEQTEQRWRPSVPSATHPNRHPNHLLRKLRKCSKQYTFRRFGCGTSRNYLLLNKLIFIVGPSVHHYEISLYSIFSFLPFFLGSSSDQAPDQSSFIRYIPIILFIPVHNSKFMGSLVSNKQNYNSNRLFSMMFLDWQYPRIFTISSFFITGRSTRIASVHSAFEYGQRLIAL